MICCEECGEEDMIEARHLTVGYSSRSRNHPVLCDVSLTVPQGAVCAVIGPSGCGKSTLLKVIAGLIHPDQGSVLLDGSPVNPKKRKIGFMPQNYGLLPWKTVRENILLGCRMKGEITAATRKEAERLCKCLGLEGLERRYPRELSGGQQQRVALARSFLLRPDVLLMDEPFSALDAITREEMQDVFLTLWKQRGTTTILVTHYVEEALYLGQTIVRMSAGPGTVAEVIPNPLAGRTEMRMSQDFFARGRELRERIRAGGCHE